MKSIKDRGKQELLAFKNRVARAYGQGRIEQEDFVKLALKVEELLSDVEALDELDEE